MRNLLEIKIYPLIFLFLFVGISVLTAEPADEAIVNENLVVEVQGQEISMNRFFATVLPGELLQLQVRGRPSLREIEFETPAVGKALVGQLKLSWEAPSKVGHHTIKVIDTPTGECLTIEVFVLRPAKQIVNGRLKGYRIGTYPAKPLRGNPAYKAPLGFIEVAPGLEKVKISPRFTLGQFLCKQQTKAKNKYLVLRPALVLKLERILDHLNQSGIKANAFHVMSGYRTPFYNKAIGNVKYSRHVYGDAADIYIDLDPKDGEMDDLNQDGRVNKADANFLYDLIDAYDRADTEMRPQGGIGGYDRNAVRGPFVHVDVRGTPARWGR